MLGALLPHSLNFQIYQILLEAKASEHSARMVAMKNATDNAMQFIKDLTLEYNKLRQANITKELLEISTAAMADGMSSRFKVQTHFRMSFVHFYFFLAGLSQIKPN